MTRDVIEKIARLIRGYYDEQLTYEELFKHAPELDSDKELSHLLGYLEHQPGKKGFFGRDTTTEYEEHKAALFVELERLVKKYSGADPAAN